MNRRELNKLTLELCNDLEKQGVERTFLVQFVGHLKVVLKYMERLPDSVTTRNVGWEVTLNWVLSGETTFSVIISEPPF